MPTSGTFRIVEFRAGTLRFLDAMPHAAPESGFLWAYTDRDSLPQHWPALQALAASVGGTPLLDLHVTDLSNPAHPSHYDYTSVYDLIIFRRLATDAETAQAPPLPGKFGGLRRIHTRAVGFAVFDRLLISVHPPSCYTAVSFVQRYLADAVHSESIIDSTTGGRSRLPTSSADLMLRMINTMVDSYLEQRRPLTDQFEALQAELLGPSDNFEEWGALMAARSQLHVLEDLCEEQRDAMVEWLDALREQNAGGNGAALEQQELDHLVARGRDIIEHIDRVMQHARRLEQSAESVVQIHFSAQSHRTNDTMRTLTALTALFLPLNLITGFFGMNFQSMPLLKNENGVWWAVGAMTLIALGLLIVFMRKRYLRSRTLERSVPLIKSLSQGSRDAHHRDG